MKTLKVIILCLIVLSMGCEPGYEFVRCADACKVSELKMLECTVSQKNSYNCKCGDPIKND